jgi:hypothetical protein
MEGTEVSWLTDLFGGRRVVRPLLAIALASQLGFDALLLTRLQIERMPFDLLDDVFLENFSLETPESALYRFAVMDVDFRQLELPLFRFLARCTLNVNPLSYGR